MGQVFIKYLLSVRLTAQEVLMNSAGLVLAFMACSPRENKDIHHVIKLVHVVITENLKGNEEKNMVL